ncbi:MAG: glutamate-1-semialdehyde 2,1-aminomutase [Candidatus Limnocylindrales bacterium]
MTAQTSARGSVSAEWRDRAEDLFPGGVNSPVRAYRAVSGEPPIIMRGEGARVWDADGVEYLDFVGAFGPLILGHAHPRVVAALTRQASRGGPFGATSPTEVELAERIREAMPSMERLRFVSSGTEAVMSALRLARAATSRELIVKFEGGYHGHVDSLLAQAGSGLATLALPASAGVPAAVASGTLLARYNDLDSVRESFAAHGEAIAAVIVEPVAANMGVVPPADGFLEGLRALTRDNGALLIFDEVITGFRVGRGGAQARYGIEPDLTTLGKIIGGGLPVGAYGGRADLMSLIAPSGHVYQAGTLSGHPLAMAAGCATLDLLGPGSYEGLEDRSARLEAGLFRTIEEVGAAASVSRVGSLLTLFFRAIAPGDFDEVRDADGNAYARFHGAMRESGILLPPASQEAWFVSAAHTDADIERTVSTAREALRA